MGSSFELLIETVLDGFDCLDFAIDVSVGVGLYFLDR